MTRSEFDTTMSWLQDFHGHRLTVHAIEFYWGEFKDINALAFAQITQDISRETGPSRVPAPIKIWERITKQREQSWQRVKDRENKKPLSDPRGSEIIKASMQLLWKRLSPRLGGTGEITQEELEAKVKELD